MMVYDKKIEEMIAPIIKAMGYELWGIEMHRMVKSVLLRIYIDVSLSSSSKHIGVDDCSFVSKQIGALFDVENPISGKYVLEVSSPGVNRSLFKTEHYERYIGSFVTIRLYQPENGRRKFVGKIKAIFDNKLELTIDNETFAFLLTNVSKANLNI